MLYVVIIFFLASIFFYCLLGGADFGAGIIELFSKKGEDKNLTRKLVSESMAPIWEANHMWLIIAVVILFNGFPKIYSQVSIVLYIPLILLLIGIIFRGTAFTFRHYDAFKDFSQEVYSRIFAASSLFVSFFFGLIVGALISGRIMVNPTGFVDAYLSPWLNLFSISTGLFICSIFAFVAAVYLIGDSTDDETRKIFITKSKYANVAMVISGGLVFGFSFLYDIGFTEKFLSNPWSLTLIILATLSLPVLWKVIEKGLVWLSRIIAGAQLFFIVGAFYIIYFPTVVVLKDSENLTLFNSAAPDSTLTYLGYALIVGSFIIFPSLYYLFKVFKVEKDIDTKSQSGD